ncbi:hypothetical protein H6G41_12335 [Tolypothrix sp. FACHB-123]|uniref:hypothetical protein n=1 Tax=Tolypothrix sp. FACHB-123 TaxID=2692868 RepID=UPI001683AEB3|nr:hypothetical protein [Tolypothrix sp. FACHB-123]MBD2355396.1 hypothetical protein [Tolypothrix sp. FACHB-123]
MFPYLNKPQDQLEQMLKEVENNPSVYVELSDTELVKIVGGAYIKAVAAMPLKKTLTLTAECTGGECTGGECTGGVECEGGCDVCTP